MGEYSPAKIKIGGNILTSLRAELAQVSTRYYQMLLYSYGADSLAGPLDIEQEFENGCKDGNGILVLCSSEASYGVFDELESFCKQHNIHFDRHSDAKDEYEGENVYYRGQTNAEKVFFASQTGKDLVIASSIRDFLRETNDILGKSKFVNAESALTDVQYILAKINEIVGAASALVPIRWVSG